MAIITRRRCERPEQSGNKQSSFIASYCTIIAKFLAIFNRLPAQNTKDSTYTTVLSNWLDSCFVIADKETTRPRDDGRSSGRGYIFRRVVVILLDGEHLVLNHVTYGHSKTDCKRKWCEDVVKELSVASPQMETESGDMIAESERAGNTIIAKDVSASEVAETGVSLGALTLACTSEPPVQFPALTNRWMALPLQTVSTVNKVGSVIADYKLPSSLYVDSRAANLLPYQQFVYSNMTVELKFVVNAHRFGAGKVIVSALPEPYGMGNTRGGLDMAISRPHIILDLASHNEGTLSVPFKYHRTFVKNISFLHSSNGVNPAQYATVTMQVLSPYVSPVGQPTTVTIRPYFRILDAKFTGMAQRFDLPAPQMETVAGVILEEGIHMIGKKLNYDKPPDNERLTQNVPKPRFNFSCGKGFSDASSLALDSRAMTSVLPDHIYPDEPKSYYDLVRKWGRKGTFTWDQAKTGSFLWSTAISVGSDSKRAFMAPIDYASAAFAFYSGTLEFRFDFVGNEYMNGAVMISCEYGRRTESVTDSSSTYTKTIQVGKQRSFTMTTPWISDRVMKRCLTTGFDDSTKDANYYGLYGQVSSFIKVRVVNPLVPITQVASSMEVIVYVRGGTDFTFHCPIQRNLTLPAALAFDQFPGTEYPNTVKKPRVLSNETAGGEDRGTLFDKLSIETQPYVHSITEKSFVIHPDTTVKLDPDSGPNRILIGQQIFEVDPTHKFVKFAGRKLALRRWKSEGQDSEVIAQGDLDGNAELDGTGTFGSRQSNFRHLQTVDDHMNFLDILRRPVCIIYNIKVKSSGNNRFYLPIMPPTALLGPLEDGTYNVPFSPLCAYSPQAHIMDMFRMWRGGVNYTIVVRGANKIVYVSQIPHNGMRWVGNIEPQSTDDSRGKIRSVPGCAGLPTEIICSAVNPTATIYCPYNSENTWTLVQEGDAKRNYSWRDKGDVNAGHLIITSEEDVNVDIWWSAADDFQIGGYMGVAHGNPRYTLLGDNNPTPQMEEDFLSCDSGDESSAVTKQQQKRRFSTTTRNVVRSVGRVVSDPSTWATALTHSIPVIGPALTMGACKVTIDDTCASMIRTTDKATEVLSSVEEDIHDISTQGQVTLSKVAAMATQGTEVLSSVDTILKCIASKLGTVVDATSSFYALFQEYLFDVVNCVINYNWKTLGLTVVRVVARLCSKPIDVFIGFMSKATSMFQPESTVSEQADNSTEQIPDGFWSEQNVKNLCGLIVGLFGIGFGVAVDDKKVPYTRIITKVFTSLTKVSGISYLNQVLRLVSVMYTTMQESFYYVLGYVSPEARLLHDLSGKSKVVEVFVRESQLMLSEMNQQSLVSPVNRVRYWFNLMRAKEIQRKMMLVPGNKVSGHLMRLCNDVIKAGNEKFSQLRCNPVRYTPFVVMVSGAPNLGKSYSTSSIIKSCLEAIDFKYMGNPVYTRQSCVEFWNGYYDQPVVVFDEWLNIRDPQLITKQLIDWFSLISSVPFVPNQAALEEKKMTANPLIVFVNCNNPFPTTNLVNHADDITLEAIYRRRNLLFDVQRHEDYVGVDLSTLSKEDSESAVHMVCRRYDDPKDHINQNVSQAFDFVTMRDMIVKEFKQYHEREMVNVTKRVNDIMKFMRDEEAFRIEDPFSLFYAGTIQASMNNENGFLPSEIFEKHMNELAAQLNELSVEPTEPAAEGITDILEWLQSKYRAVHEWIAQPTPERKWECAVCNSEVVSAWCCSNGNTDVVHVTCEPCLNQMLAINGAFCCPVCRDDAYGRVYDSKMLMHLLQAIKFPESRPRFWATYKTTIWWVSAVQTLSHFLRSPTFDNAMTIYGSFMFGCLHQATRAQGLETQSYRIRPRFFGPSCPRVRITYLKNDDYDVCPMTVGPVEQCCHIGFMEDLDIPDMLCTASYMDGAYYWATSDEWSLIPMACTPDCRMMNNWSHFTDKYFETQKDAAFAYLTECHNSSEPFLKRFPRFCWPKWLPRLDVEDSTPSNWWDFIEDPKVKYVLKFLALGAVVVGALKGLQALYGVMAAKPQLISSGATPVRLFSKPITRVVSKPVAQMSADDAIQAKVARNYFSILCIRGDKVVKQLTGLGIRDRIGLIPRHYYNWLEECKDTYDEVWVERSLLRGVRTNWLIDAQSFLVSPTSDVAVAYLPVSFQPFVSLIKYFVTDDDLQGALSRTATLLEIPNRTVATVCARDIKITGFRNSQLVRSTFGDYETKHNLVYEFSKAGACGSMALLNDRTRPIISMHIAGSQYEGFGVLISQEALADIPNKPTQPQAAEQMMPDWIGPIDNCGINFDEETALLPIGSLPKDMVPYSPKQTAIRPSEVSELLPWPTKQITAILHKSDPRYIHDISPLVAGCQKMGRLTINFPKHLLDEVLEVEQIAFQAMKPTIVNPVKLTIEQAVAGLEVEYYTPLKMDTSMGYVVYDGKLLTKDGRSQKKHYMDIQRNEHGKITGVQIDRRIVELCKEEEAMRKAGVRPFVGFVSTLKDERRPYEKAMKLGGTRVIDAAPATYVIAMRQSFLHFSAAYMHERLNFPHAVGMNMTGAEVTTLISKLRNVGNKFITLDYSNFGPGLNSEVSWYTDKIMMDWTRANVKGVNDEEMALLLEEGLSTNHVIYNSIYQDAAGSPSGSPITVIKNSLVNNFYLKLAWSIIYEANVNKIYESLKNTQYHNAGKWTIFRKLICIFVYGDDVIMTVADELAEIWNAITIMDTLAEYGITATDASKTGKRVPYTGLEEASFLKHFFSYHPWRSEWMAALSEDNIRDIPHWIFKGADNAAATRVNCEAALRHIFPHGKEKFAEFRKILNDALIRIGEEPLDLTWNELDRKRYEIGPDGLTLEKKSMEFY